MTGTPKEPFQKKKIGNTDEEKTFKKPFQVVGRPETTDHNMHDDYIRDPPVVCIILIFY
jgi:hypothetical protein